MNHIRISNIPPEIGETLKIAAARQGMTITAFIIQTLRMRLYDIAREDKVIAECLTPKVIKN